MSELGTIENPLTGTFSELLDVMDLHVETKLPPFIWGSPGIGKSQLVAALAKKAGAWFHDWRASQWDAVDTRGAPYVAEIDGRKLTAWAIPQIFPTAAECAAHDLVVIFLDELNTAAPSVMAALYQLILDRRLGDYVLPDNVLIIAAGNKETDRAISNRMGTALADRFFHYELAVDHMLWLEHAADADFHPAVTAFIGLSPNLLHQFDPKSKSHAQATPRGWEFVSRMLYAAETQGKSTSTVRLFVIGKLGEAVGNQFMAFLPLYKDMPNPADVLADPDNYPVPRNPSVAYALSVALARRADKKTTEPAITFIKRLGQEIGRELEVLACMCIPKKARNSRAYAVWAADCGL